MASAAPAELNTLNFTVASDVPAPTILITPLAGVTETYSRLPAWAGFTMIIVWTGGTVPTDACMMTGPVIETSAVKVTDAIPFTVLADAAESAPAYGGRDVIAKFTTVPSVTGLFTIFRTFAVIFVVWPLMRLELTTFREIDAGALVIKKLALTGVRAPDVAVICTAPEDEPEKTVAEATPEALVVTVTALTSVVELKLAREVPVVIVKVAGVLNTGAPVALKSVTFTAA